MSENIQAKLFNGQLAWTNNEVVWFSETKPEPQPEQKTPILDSLANADQLYFSLGDEYETP